MTKSYGWVYSYMKHKFGQIYSKCIRGKKLTSTIVTVFPKSCSPFYKEILNFPQVCFLFAASIKTCSCSCSCSYFYPCTCS